MEKREKWFIDRIGKKIFRNKTTCNCGTCKNVYENGLIISDDTHACYIWEMEGHYRKDRIKLKYFDTKKEVLKFENEIQ